MKNEISMWLSGLKTTLLKATALSTNQLEPRDDMSLTSFELTVNYFFRLVKSTQLSAIEAD